MRAVHQKAPGAHGGKAFERRGDPVLLADAAKREAVGRRIARHRAHEVADHVLVGLRAEIDLRHPFLGRPAIGRRMFLEGGGGGFRGVESLDDRVGDQARGRLVGLEPHHIGGAVGGKSFKHGARLAWRADGVMRR